MKAFRFKLQPLLEQRLGIERAHQREVAVLERRRAELEGVIRARQGEVARVKGEMRRAMRPGEGSARVSVDPGGIRLGAAASFRAQSRARDAAVALAGVVRQLERARGVLREAARARRSVELLKERREAEWRAAVRRAEANEVDEVANGRAARAAQGRREGV